MELLEQIAEWCERFTPLSPSIAPDGLILDITGAAHLFGGEAVMLAHVTQNTAQGFAVQAAIAGTSSAARALAKFAPGHIATPGAEAKAWNVAGHSAAINSRYKDHRRDCPAPDSRPLPRCDT